MNEIILNRIKTPDGTILTSYHRHDYKTYVDKNGKTYGVDGGRAYLKRIGERDYTDLSVDSSAPYDIIRKSFYWGTYGKPGTPRKFKWITLAEMSDNHLKAVIEDGYNVPWFKKEVEYRKGKHE